MTTPTNTVTTTNHGIIPQDTSDPLSPEGALHRCITAELYSLKLAFQGRGMGDTLSDDILLWHDSFSEAITLKAIKLRNGDLNGTIEEYIEKLQLLLCVPSPFPFDRRGVWLDTDTNHSYGEMALLVHLSDHPPQPGQPPRSPMNLQSNAPFSVVRHPLVEQAIKWLDDTLLARHPLPRSEEIESRYEDHVRQRTLASIPYRDTLFAMQPQAVPNILAETEMLMTGRQQRARRREAEALQFLENLENEVMNEIQAVFQPNAVNEVGQQIAQRIDDLEQHAQQEIADLEQQIAAINVDVAQLEQDNEDNAARLVHIDEEIGLLGRENERRAMELHPLLQQERAEEELGRLLQQLEQLPDPVQERFAAFRIEMEEQMQRNEERVNAVEHNAEVQLQRLRVEILECAVDEMEDQIDRIEAREERLEESFTSLNQKLDKAEAHNVRIQLLSIQVEKAIKKREKSAMNGVLTTCVIVGACALATWGASVAIEALIAANGAAGGVTAGATAASAGGSGGKITAFVAVAL
jgi:hypothetical protein